MSDKRIDSTTRAEKLSAFLQSYRKLLLIVGAAMVVSVFGAVVAYQVYDTRMERATREAELLTEDWEEWNRTVSGDDDAQLKAAETNVRSRAEALISDYPRSYGALRALQILTLLEWELENYDEVRITALKLVESFPRSHLAGTALVNAAAASEAAGDSAEARRLLDRVAGGEGAPTVEKARALFNLGRLAEEAGSPTEALEYYSRLVSEHPDSNWTNLGRNRIIWLNSTGVGAES
jgi:tetratricopeptide (TPR) repeat protein